MNPGVIGLAAQRGVRSYQSPWVPLSAFTVGNRYTIQHPFDKVPMLVKTLVRCKVAQDQLTPGMVWQDNANGYRQMNFSFVMQPFKLEATLCNALAFLIVSPPGTTAFNTASFEVSFLVIA